MKTKILLFALLVMAAFSSKAQFLCNASFTYTLNPSGVVTFSAAAATPNTSYIWDFGNGSTGGGQNVTAVYNTAGNFTVCLLIIDSTITPICMDSSCQTITITSPGGGGGSGCNAAFTIVPDSSAGAGAYLGINSSTGTGLSYYWTWGDGNTSTGAYPSHTYAAPGIYTICLYVTGGGCIDSVCNTFSLKTAGVVTVNFSSNPMAVSDLDTKEIRIYPNPVSDNLTINSTSNDILQIEIYNLHGSKVKSFQVNGKQSVSVSELASGNYLLRVINKENKSSFTKFEKQ